MINLDSSPDRLAFQEAQFAVLGLPFTRISAVAGTSIDEAFYRRMRASGARILRRNEVGCTLSHVACWRHCVQRGEPVVIFEDDVVIDPAFGSLLRELCPVAREADMLVNFECHSRRKRVGAELGRTADGRFSLCDLLIGEGGTGGYYITPAVAARLLKLAERRIYLADTHMNILAGVQYAQVSPAPVAQLMSFKDRDVAGSATQSVIGKGGARRPGSMSSFLRHPLTRLRRFELYLFSMRRKTRAWRQSGGVPLKRSPRLEPARLAVLNRLRDLSTAS